MINDALRLVRVYHNLKQKELSEALDIAPSYLSEIESGKKQPTLELLESYAKHFRMPLSSLLYFSEHRDSGNPQPGAHPIAGKAIKMLEWLDMITNDSEDEEKISS